jgi:UDP-N-acetylmuramate--alanine ligase
VTGCDLEYSLITAGLTALGVRVFVGHDPQHLPSLLDLMVYSPAVTDGNLELCIAKERRVSILSYPEALGIISKKMRTIAISGTHGKTTTTAMVAAVLAGAHKDPTVIVGSLLKESQGNFISGDSDIFVVEACEYKRSFLNLSPEILVITNIDNDHLDYYGTIEGVQKAFAELAQKVPGHGTIVCDPCDPRLAPVLLGVKARVVNYTHEVLTKPLAVFGEHNKKNAQAALAVTGLLDVSHREAMGFLARFQGVWRRMERKGEMDSGAVVYDDYAHHPTEIRAALHGFRAQYPRGRLRIVFQPHLYSRTKLLLNDFARSFGDADEVVVAPIYAAREMPDPEVSSEKLAEAIGMEHKSVRRGGGFNAIENYFRTTAQKGDVIVVMGAGDVYKVGEALAADFK